MYKLTDYQNKHVLSIKELLIKNNRCLDTSKTGSGKTYTALEVCKILNYRPFIITTKINIEHWETKIREFNMDYYGITNYELLQHLQYYKNGEKLNVNFLTKNYEIIVDSLPQIIIYDENHKCKNINTKNGYILYQLSSVRNLNILLLSATTNDLQKQLVFLGYILKMYDSFDEGKKYLLEQSRHDKNIMLTFNKLMYPNYAVMMKTPKSNNINTIHANVYSCENDDKIIDEYKKLENIEDMQNKRSSMKSIHQKIEILLIPVFNKLIKEHLDNNKSVVVFLNFTKSIQIISSFFNCKCLIHGEITMQQRLNNIKNFNNNDEKLIICNIQCGSTGISLHDLSGTNERVSIISPTLSTQDLLQSLGRINRHGACSKTEQYIIFSNCKYGIEMCKLIKDKINNIGLLNDGEQTKSTILINGLIENYKDRTHIHKELNITKKDIQNIEIEKQRIIKKEAHVKFRNELPINSLNINEILKKLSYLKYKKQNATSEEDIKNAQDELDNYKKLFNEKIKGMV
jgi:superfamily II DNA or RNA helicase